MKKLRLFFWGIIFLLFFVSLYNIISRIQWENEKKVFFVIDIDYFLANNKDFETIKIDLNKKLFFGISYNFFLSSHKYYSDKEVVLKIDKDLKYDFLQFSKFLEIYKDKIFSIIFTPQTNSSSISLRFINVLGEKINNKKLKSLLEEYNFIKLNFESDEEKISSRKVLSLRSFVLDLNINKELVLERQTNLALLKIKKAIFERSCSLVYIIPSEYLSYNENISVIRNILSNFIVVNDFSKLKTFKTISFGKINNILVLFLSIIIPLIIYQKVRFKKINEPKEIVYIKVNFFTLFLGIFIWGFMQEYGYISLEEKICGAKLMFLLPIILSPFFVFNKTELKEIYNYQIKLKDIFIAFFIIIIFWYIFLRTGNVGKEFVLKYELSLREIIEKRILFRPRFKEIFFAQPLFLFSLYLVKKYNKILWTKILFCISILSQVSIINTFLHIHTPIHLCFLRSIVGVFLGLIIGEIIIFVFEKIKIEKYFTI